MEDWGRQCGQIIGWLRKLYETCDREINDDGIYEEVLT